MEISWFPGSILGRANLVMNFSKLVLILQVNSGALFTGNCLVLEQVIGAIV